MAKMVYKIFYRDTTKDDDEWTEIHHFFSSRKKAVEWTEPMLKYRDPDGAGDREYHIQGYPMDPDSMGCY
jgi:hypothetical protein